jgi:hypothetical protein
MLLEERDETLAMRRDPPVIGVEERDDIAGRCLDAAVSRGTWTSVRGETDAACA